MQRNTENDRWLGKALWETLVMGGSFISPGAAITVQIPLELLRTAAIALTLLGQPGLQIRAADVNIRVQKKAPRIAEAG